MLNQISVMALAFNKYQFLIIVFALINLVHNDTICFPPYDCIAASLCASRLSARDIAKVLFRCEDKSKICCPPAKALTKHSTENHTIEAAESGKYPPKYNASNRRPETHTNQVKGNCSFCNYGHGDEISSPTILPTTTEESPESKISSHRNFHLLPSMCGLNQSPNRITEGEEADLGEFPWMALVGVRDKLGNLRWLCGGTLINYRYILTAAHCVYREEGSVPIVRLGEHNLDNNTDCDNGNSFCLNPAVDFTVEEVIVHNKWNISTIKNDIALYRLSENATESFSISPICLPVNMKTRNISESVKYEVAGWGKTDWNAQPGSNVLRKGTISSVANIDCNICKSKIKEMFCPISRTQMCAQGWKFVDVCKGDSGGPLMLTQQKVYQVGITSFKVSEYCGADNIPSIFTRVESYLEWILDHMRA